MKMAAVAIADGTEAGGKEVFASRYDRRAQWQGQIQHRSIGEFPHTRAARVHDQNG